MKAETEQERRAQESDQARREIVIHEDASERGLVYIRNNPHAKQKRGKTIKAN